MKKLIPTHILIFTGIFLGLWSCGKHNRETDSLYARIDSAIDSVSFYDADKEKRITNLKDHIRKESSPEIRRELTDWLIAEYEAYISDSALFYINENLKNPTVVGNEYLTTGLLIKKGDLAAHAGLFGESAEILESIPKEVLDSSLLVKYYSAFCDLYQYQSEYAVDSEYGRRHEKLREAYIDSISMVAPRNSMEYISNYSAAQARNGNFEEAVKLVKEHLDKYTSGERNYSILASILADFYRSQGDKDNYRKYLSMSVISDLRGAIKENMAIRALATECYEDGDLERADRYLRQSFADANFYSARMRNAQSSRMLPIIGESYTTEQKSLNHKLRVLIVFISILAFGFIIISILALLQLKKIHKINKKTKDALEEVSVLTESLTEANKKLSEANEELHNLNAVQGEYGVLFMEYCSASISALLKYQQSLKVTAVQGNYQTLVKKIESANFETKAIAEFYTKFDEAVLNIYPNFIQRFNELLRPEERYNYRENEGLSTELRVVALIRIGIGDSEKIAQFLRCSLSTVYTYRSKLKKRAINPDTFEEDIRKL